MSRTARRVPAGTKAPPSLQQQLASGKRAKAARQTQQAQGRRRLPDAALPASEVVSVGANVAGASHVSASRLLALLTQPAAQTAAVAAQPQPLALDVVVHPKAALRGQHVQTAAAYSLDALIDTARHAAPPAAPTSISDNRRRQMGSSVFNTDSPPQPLAPTRHPQPQQPTHFAPPPPAVSLPPPHVSAGMVAVNAEATVTSPMGRQSWGGGGRSLEAGSGARDAERQKKLDMRASLDAQMREKEEKKRQEKAERHSADSRVQDHWLDASAHRPAQQPLSTTATTVSQHTSSQPPLTATQPFSVEMNTTGPLTSPRLPSQPSAPSSSMHLSSIRSHNQSSSVFAANGNESTEQRKAAVRAEVQAALRQQMEEKRQREEGKKRAEQEEERRWEERLERERREIANRHANGGVVAAAVEERKDAVVARVGGGTSARGGRAVEEHKEQLSVREERKERPERRRGDSDGDTGSDEEEADDRRRRRKSKERRASRHRDRRSTRRHSDSNDSASSSDASSDRRSRRRKSSRQPRRRRERRSKHSSQSDEDERVENECIYVADKGYTLRQRYEQEQKELEDALMSASSSRRHSTSMQSKPKPGSSSSHRSAAAAAPPQPKPAFGVRSMQTRAKPKPPASRVRALPPPLPAGDTRASKQALSAARLAMGRTSGGGDKFVAQKWKEKQTAAEDAQARPPKAALRTARGTGDGSASERSVVDGGRGVMNQAMANVRELSFADRLDTTSEWLLPHSLGLPSFRA